MVSDLIEVPELEVSITGVATEATLLDVKDLLDSKLAGSLVPVEHDEVVTTYVGSTSDISTVVYKLAGVTVATLTLTYDGSNRLIGVVRT